VPPIDAVPHVHVTLAYDGTMTFRHGGTACWFE